MTDVLSGILTASCVIVGGYLFYKCAVMQRRNNEYYVIPNIQLIEKQPPQPPPEYSVATAPPSAPVL